MGMTLKGKVVFEFLEDPEGSWFSKVTPVVLPVADVRDTYKLALMVAVLQDTCKKKLDIVDRLIKEKAEIEKLQEEEPDLKPFDKAINEPDIIKYQTKLPFEEDTNGKD